MPPSGGNAFDSEGSAGRVERVEGGRGANDGEIEEADAEPETTGAKEGETEEAEAVDDERREEDEGADVDGGEEVGERMRGEVVGE